MRAWHFLSDNGKTQFTDEEVVPEKWLEAKEEIKLCLNGMHASKRIIDALTYAPGSMICRVEVEGELIGDSDKLAGRRRKVIWMFDGTMLLHEFGCRCAEDILAKITNPDPRAVAAVAAKRAWMKGEITGDELSAASCAAYSPASYAAHYVVYTVAHTAAHWAASYAAHWAAHWAASYAASSTSQKKQNKRLTSMVMSEARKQGLC